MTDTERLDYLQKALGTYTGKVICRLSDSNKGWRLHETSLNVAVPNVREAIDNFIESNKDLTFKLGLIARIMLNSL